MRQIQAPRAQNRRQNRWRAGQWGQVQGMAAHLGQPSA
jgi:hypothetical protein